MCGHYCCKDWLDLVHCHDTMRKKGLEEGTVHVGVGFFVWYIAHERRLVPRHSD